MPSPTNSRKRKAEVLEAADTSEPKPGAAVSSSHLPATCLAAVLNFLPYFDVRQCMLAGKTMAVEAASQVETLNITKPSELVGPAARRFAHVSQLNILCLVSTALNYNQTLSMTTAARTPTFLTIFPKLKSAFVGGVRSIHGPRHDSYLYQYNWYDCPERSDHKVVFRVLAESLCGAFQAKMLSADLVIKGLQFGGQLDCKCQHSPSQRSQNQCRFCRSIIASFPLHSVMLSISSHSFCPSNIASLDALLKRSDGATALQSDGGKEMIARVLGRYIRTHNVPQEEHPEFSRAVMTKGATHLTWDKKHSVHFLSPYSLPVMKAIVQVVSTEVVRSIPSAYFSGSFFPSNKGSKGKPIVLRDAMDALIGLGCNLNPTDYVLVDMHKEPALVGMKGQMLRSPVESGFDH